MKKLVFLFPAILAAQGGYNGTSSTSMTPGVTTGYTTIITQSGLSYLPGVCLVVTSNGTGASIAGPTTAYNSATGSLTFYATTNPNQLPSCSGASGFGPHTDWILSANFPGGGGGGGTNWGQIGGIITNQTDLQAALNTKISNPMSTAGDFIVGGTSGVPTRLATPGNGTFCPNWSSGTVTWISCPGSGGGISSIGLTMPAWFSVANSPLIANGTIAVTAAGSQTSHQVIGTCGSSTSFGPCSLVPGDIPILNQNTTGTASNITGIILEANGGTGANNTTGAAGHYLRSNGTHYVDNTIQISDVPVLNQNTTGNAATATALAATPIQCTGSNFATGIAANGNANCSAPSGSGNVNGPGSSTVNFLTQWNNTSGTLLKAGLPVATTSAANTVVEAGSGGLIDLSYLPIVYPTTLTAAGFISTGTGVSGIDYLEGSTSGGYGWFAPATAGVNLAVYSFGSIGTPGQVAVNNGTVTCPSFPAAAPGGLTCYSIIWVTKTTTIATGTAALGTSSISSGACATVVTVSAPGVLTTDSIPFSPNTSIKAITGYAPTISGGLTVNAYPTSGNVNFDVCNWSSGSITPGAVTLNWEVIR